MVQHQLLPQTGHVLVCVQYRPLGEVIHDMLTEEGLVSTCVDYDTWLADGAPPGQPPDVIILDAWPLRENVAVQAQYKIIAQSVPVVLVIDGAEDVALANRLGIPVSLPLFFSMDDLMSVIQQAMMLHSGFLSQLAHQPNDGGLCFVESAPT